MISHSFTLLILLKSSPSLQLHRYNPSCFVPRILCDSSTLFTLASPPSLGLLPLLSSQSSVLSSFVRTLGNSSMGCEFEDKKRCWMGSSDRASRSRSCRAVSPVSNSRTARRAFWRRLIQQMSVESMRMRSTKAVRIISVVKRADASIDMVAKLQEGFVVYEIQKMDGWWFGECVAYCCERYTGVLMASMQPSVLLDTMDTTVRIQPQRVAQEGLCI